MKTDIKVGDKFEYIDEINHKYILTYTGTRREVKGCMFEFFTDDSGNTCFFSDDEVKKFAPIIN